MHYRKRTSLAYGKMLTIILFLPYYQT